MSLNRENTGWSEDGTSGSTVILSYVAVGLCNCVGTRAASEHRPRGVFLCARLRLTTDSPRLCSSVPHLTTFPRMDKTRPPLRPSPTTESPRQPSPQAYIASHSTQPHMARIAHSLAGRAQFGNPSPLGKSLVFYVDLIRTFCTFSSPFAFDHLLSP